MVFKEQEGDLGVGECMDQLGIVSFQNWGHFVGEEPEWLLEEEDRRRRAKKELERLEKEVLREREKLKDMEEAYWSYEEDLGRRLERLAKKERISGRQEASEKERQEILEKEDILVEDWAAIEDQRKRIGYLEEKVEKRRREKFVWLERSFNEVVQCEVAFREVYEFEEEEEEFQAAKEMQHRAEMEEQWAVWNKVELVERLWIEEEEEEVVNRNGWWTLDGGQWCVIWEQWPISDEAGQWPIRFKVEAKVRFYF